MPTGLSGRYLPGKMGPANPVGAKSRRREPLAWGTLFH